MNQQLKDAAKELDIQLRKDIDENVTSVGITDTQIVVYLQHGRFRKLVPKEFKGYEVITEVTGKIRLL